MVTVVRTYAPWIYVTGTIAEVVAHLKAQAVPHSMVTSVFYNGTDMTGVYKA